jgi:hypothetical protein
MLSGDFPQRIDADMIGKVAFVGEGLVHQNGLFLSRHVKVSLLNRSAVVVKVRALQNQSGINCVIRQLCLKSGDAAVKFCCRNFVFPLLHLL